MENISHQVNVLCDSLRALTSLLPSKTTVQFCILLRFFIIHSLGGNGTKTVLYHYFEDIFGEIIWELIRSIMISYMSPF